MWDKIIKTICAVGGAIAGMFGQWPEMLTILVVAMTLDYISGLSSDPRPLQGGNLYYPEG